MSRKVGQVRVPKIGRVRFRWSRAVPDSVRSYRITRDSANRWYVAFAAVPQPLDGAGNGEIVGIDRGIAVSAALSTGDLLMAPGLRMTEEKRLLRLRRKLARAKRGIDRRKDWIETISTDLARRFDRSIHAAGWGRLVTRLEEKAPGHVEKIKPAYTSQTCHACGHCDPKNRESQAVFRCRACGHADHADVNAAKNIAAGRAVTARGADEVLSAKKREPQLSTSSP